MSQVVGVVIHVTAGEGDPYNEFVNPANQVSSHFGIGNGQGGMADGLIEQYVDTGFESWAQVAGNATYISVETEGEPPDPLTPAQVASFARIMAWVNQTYKVPLAITDTPGQPGLITHGDGGVAWGNHIDCPGPLRSAQRADILARAQALVSSPPINQKDIMFAFENTKGQTVIVGTVNGHTAVVTSGADAKVEGGWSVADVTDAIAAAYPNTNVVVS